MLYNSREEFYCSNNMLYKYKVLQCIYGSTSVRWIVRTLMPNRTYECQPLSGAFDCSSVYIAINPAAIV